MKAEAAAELISGMGVIKKEEGWPAVFIWSKQPQRQERRELYAR